MIPRMKAFIVLMTLLLVGASGSPSYAVLKAVGPVSQSTGFFPVWYMDLNGEVMELCIPAPGIELTDGYCLLLPADIPNPAAPISFPDNFPEEAFWWSAGASIDLPTGGSADLVLALEAAFAGGPVLSGDQVSFGRVRIRIDTPIAGTYTVTHPFGIHTFTVTEEEIGDRAINFTDDIGISVPGVFTGALASKIGPFLKASATPGGAPLPYFSTPLLPGKFYLANPAATTKVTGSPLGTQFNVFRVEGPAGFGTQETSDFDLQGRVFNGTPVSIERATYSRTPSAIQIDVFASSVDSATLTAGLIGSPQTTMAGVADNFFGSFLAATLPASAAVTAAQPGKESTTVESAVKDIVTITQADYSPAAGILTITATSSDQNVTTLTVENIGSLSNGGAATFPLTIPPVNVTVTSPQGGVDVEPVIILAGNLPPTALGDSYSVDAGSTLIENAPGVLGNDSDPENNLPLIAVLATVASNGTLTLNADGSFSYTPNPGFSGQDSFTYRAQDSLGALSAPATVSITVNAPESISVTRAVFRTTGSIWIVEGTSTPIGAGTGNTITIYLGPTVGGTVIGTTTVQADGTWSFRQAGISPGIRRTISVESSSGAIVEGFTLRVRL